VIGRRWLAAGAVTLGAAGVVLSGCDDSGSGDPGYDSDPYPVVQVDPYGHTHTVTVTPRPTTPRGGAPTRRTVVQPRPAAPKPAAPRPAAPKPAPPKIKMGK
jgi:hypothetical protein